MNRWRWLLLLCTFGLAVMGCGNAPMQDQEVPAFDDETVGQVEQPICSGVTWKEVSKGSSHTCAVTTDSRLYCWGANYRGQLGDGTTTHRSRPTFVTGYIDHVYAGGDHTCAVTTTATYPANQLLCWGGNTLKQVKGTATYYTTPQTITGLALPLKDVSAGSTNTCVVDANSRLRCWGDRSQCQDGVAVNNTPTDVPWYAPLRPGFDLWGAYVGKVLTGNSFVCGAGNATAKTIRCWGFNPQGALGNGTATWPTPQCYPYDFEVPWKTTKTSVMSGYQEMVCAAPEDGSSRPYCAGANGVGQLGRGYVSTSPNYEPWPASISTTVPLAVTTPVSRGTSAGMALVPSGMSNNLWVWGEGTYGALGQGDENNHLDPVRLYVGGNPLGSKNASAGGYGGCALNATGSELYCWGDNRYGQVGDNTLSTRMSPVSIDCP